MKEGGAAKPKAGRTVRELHRSVLEGGHPKGKRILSRQAKAKGQQIELPWEGNWQTEHRELQFTLFWRHDADPEETELRKKKNIHKTGTLCPKALLQIILK